MQVEFKVLPGAADFSKENAPHAILPLAAGESWAVVDAPVSFTEAPKFAHVRTGDGIRVPLFPYQLPLDRSVAALVPSVIGAHVGAHIYNRFNKPIKKMVAIAGDDPVIVSSFGSPDPEALRVWLGFAFLEER